MNTQIAHRSTTAPSPTEIRQRCREIQATWSVGDRLQRAGVVLGNPIRFVSPESRLLAAVSGRLDRDRAA